MAPLRKSRSIHRALATLTRIGRQLRADETRYGVTLTASLFDAIGKIEREVLRPLEKLHE